MKEKVGFIKIHQIVFIFKRDGEVVEFLMQIEYLKKFMKGNHLEMKLFLFLIRNKFLRKNLFLILVP